MSENHFYSLLGPLDTLPVGRQVRIAKLNGFPSFARSRGADPRAILERHNIDPLLISNPDHYVDCKSVVDLFEYCSAKFSAPLFGLQLAQYQETEVFGCVAALCRSAPTLRESIQCFIDYIPIVHSPTASLELVDGKSTAELRWKVHNDLAHNTQANYQAVWLALKLLRQVGGAAFRPFYVNLSVARDTKNLEEIERRLSCRFHRTTSENAIGFSCDLLELPVVSANRLVFKLLGGYLDRVRSISRQSLEQRVSDYVRGALPSGHASIERCAQKLGLSVRTLQTKLSEADLNYIDILASERVDLAKTYLSDEYLSLTDIARDLGYGEQSSFGRAFKRWTGMTPKLYRDIFSSAQTSLSTDGIKNASAESALKYSSC